MLCFFVIFYQDETGSVNCSRHLQNTSLQFYDDFRLSGEITEPSFRLPPGHLGCVETLPAQLGSEQRDQVSFVERALLSACPFIFIRHPRALSQILEF